ncbi:hypothetical protein, partial [Sinorhizobium fredii]|uniref:hypothetical protein n=1 Tax=Rhizobium fredii TaxID=380 RepID=UPI001AF02474
RVQAAARIHHEMDLDRRQMVLRRHLSQEPGIDVAPSDMHWQRSNAHPGTSGRLAPSCTDERFGGMYTGTASS